MKLPFGIVDSHLHVWDINKLPYPWLQGVPSLNRTLLPDDYNEAAGSLPIETIVFMQCDCEPTRYMEEVHWVTELAADDRRIRGIVSYAPLEKGEAVRPELEELKRNPLVKGIRRIIQNEQDPDFCLQDDFVVGVRMLAEFGLTFDLCIDYRHTRQAAELVRRCPDVRFILDHLGKPGIRQGLLDPWRDETRELAAASNVVCKVSSLATEADHTSWTLDEIRPYVRHIFETFGFARLLFGSDWPVSTQADTLEGSVQTLLVLLQEAGASEDELRKVFHDNAVGFYGLPESVAK